MIKVNVKSIHVFAFIKNKATWTPDLTHGEDIPAEKLVDTDWKDFEDPIVVLSFQTFSLPTLVKTYLMETSLMKKSWPNLFVWDRVMNFGLIQPTLLLNTSTTSFPL
jgi:hypothetical protein